MTTWNMTTWNMTTMEYDHIKYDHMKYDHIKYDHIKYDHMKCTHTVNKEVGQKREGDVGWREALGKYITAFSNRRGERWSV